MKHISDIIEDIESNGTLPSEDHDVKTYTNHLSRKRAPKKKAQKLKKAQKSKALEAICKMRGIKL